MRLCSCLNRNEEGSHRPGLTVKMNAPLLKSVNYSLGGIFFFFFFGRPAGTNTKKTSVSDLIGP